MASKNKKRGAAAKVAAAKNVPQKPNAQAKQVPKPEAKKDSPKKQVAPKVKVTKVSEGQKTITKGNKKKKSKAKAKAKRASGKVDEAFQVDGMQRYTGKVEMFRRGRGFGFIKLDQAGVVPEDKVMVLWKDIQSEDRWPSLNKDMLVEFNLDKTPKDKLFTIVARHVSGPGGEPISVQESLENEKSYVGDKNMRFLGNVKRYNTFRGLGIVVLQDGYDIDDTIPKEFAVRREEISCPHETPRLREGMEIEFGISKDDKDRYECYNVTLEGGQEIGLDIVDARENVTTKSFTGIMTKVHINHGFITPDNMSQLPKAHQEKMKAQAEAKKAKKANAKDEQPVLYYHIRDFVDKDPTPTENQKVNFKAYTDVRSAGACEIKFV